MISIKRKMDATKSFIGTGNLCQASFNSDGNLTIRHHNSMNDNEDIITVLNEQETRAIIRLFQKMKELHIINELPF